jgi:hypothetical protein
MTLPFRFPLYEFAVAGPEETKNPSGESPPPDSDPFSNAELARNVANPSREFATDSLNPTGFAKTL